jgi:hypothetical protein
VSDRSGDHASNGTVPLLTLTVSESLAPLVELHLAGAYSGSWRAADS